MRRFYSILTAVIMVMALTGCKNAKQVAYIQNSQEVDLSEATRLYEAKIMPKDQLAISVYLPTNPTAVEIFNLGGNTGLGTNVAATVVGSPGSASTYLVDNDGNINFPTLGKMHVLGMTKGELERSIANKIAAKYTNEEPLVTVVMSNYKFAVIGDVGSPGIYTSITGKVNLLEALAMAGDLAITGQRKNIKLIRENAFGEKSIVELDLTDANIFSSEYYQIQQNDIIYVTPNKIKRNSASNNQNITQWWSFTNSLISIANLIINITRW